MIACNACQLLATNLPVCHSCVLEALLSTIDGFFFHLEVILKRYLTKLLSIDMLSSNMTSLKRWPRGRLICNLQHFVDFISVILHAFFTPFEAQDGLQNRLNLVCLRVLVGLSSSYLRVMLI